MADEITADYDEVINKHEAWARSEKDAASDAGERRQAIGQFVEKCGFENKAFSQFRAGMKIKNEGKQRDWLRSMKVLLEIAEQRITGNQPELPMEDEAPEPHDEIQQEADEFDAAADETLGDGVVPFGEAAE